MSDKKSEPMSESEKLFWCTVVPFMVAFDLVLVGLAILSTALG